MANVGVKYNSETWQQTVTIINPLIVEGGSAKYVELDNGFITKILLSNYIYKYSPRLTIQYTDIDYRLLNFIQIGTTYVLLHMKNLTKDDGLDIEGVHHDPSDLYCGFIIDNIEMLDQDKKGATISIKCVHSNIHSLCRKITYATNKAKGQVSPLRIIQQLFTLIDYDINPNYVETDRKIDFTSIVGQRLNQMVDYLLRQAVTPQIPPSYLYHNIKNEQVMIYNRQLIPDSVLRTENIFYVYTSGGLDQNVERNVISDVRCGSLLGGIYTFDQYGDYIFHQFDQEKRKWNYTKFEAKNILNLMTDNFIKNNDKKYTTDLYYDKDKVFNSEYKEKRCYEFPNQSYSYMYDYLKDLELFSSTMSFKARGETDRDVGQVVMIKSSSSSLNSFYGGYWTITEIAHCWENGMYINEIMCHRTVKERTDVDEDHVFSNTEL